VRKVRYLNANWLFFGKTAIKVTYQFFRTETILIFNPDKVELKAGTVDFPSKWETIRKLKYVEPKLLIFY